QGVMVVLNGTVQTYACPSPQQYVTLDQSSSGWACEQTTGVWLLHALPPQQTTYTYQQPQTYATAPDVSVYSYPYGYSSYGYYPSFSYYPYVIGPRLGVGFGFRSPIIVGRPGVIRGGRAVVPFVASRPFGGFRQTGRGFGRIGRR